MNCTCNPGGIVEISVVFLNTMKKATANLNEK